MSNGEQVASIIHAAPFCISAALCAKSWCLVNSVRGPSYQFLPELPAALHVSFECAVSEPNMRVSCSSIPVMSGGAPQWQQQQQQPGEGAAVQ